MNADMESVLCPSRSLNGLTRTETRHRTTGLTRSVRLLCGRRCSENNPFPVHKGRISLSLYRLVCLYAEVSGRCASQLRLDSGECGSPMPPATAPGLQACCRSGIGSFFSDLRLAAQLDHQSQELALVEPRSSGRVLT